MTFHRALLRRLSALPLCLCGIGALDLPPARAADTQTYRVFRQDQAVGRLEVQIDGRLRRVVYDVKDNGRGPTVEESLELNAEGLPQRWRIRGTQTFGGAIDEQFDAASQGATWRDAGGPGQATEGRRLYIAQSASPWALELYAQAALRAGGSVEVWPAGTLTLTRRETLNLQTPQGEVPVTRYELSGLNLNPTHLLLDGTGRLVALPNPNGGVIRTGFEGEVRRLMQSAAQWEGARWAALQRDHARRYAGPVRVRNVHVFDPSTLRRTAPVSVVVHGRVIAGIQPLDAPATPGETIIEGEGGTLVPGMFEMHGHLGESAALLNVLAGVTSVRDMGNNNPVLADLQRRIESGEVAGPRILRSGFIEGRSPFSSTSGFVVSTQEQAVDAVRWYAARGFEQIKIYNSIQPAWVPAMVAEARRLGLRTMGHVPAFTTADAMLAAGYDELTHINQLALGWLIAAGEDTRTLFRLTALGRLPRLDLSSAPVQATLDAMKTRGIALDATLGIHESLLLGRNGEVAPGARDYFEHMPVNVQRGLKQAWSEPEAFGGDANARAAFDRLTELLRQAHAKGILLVPGTDTGGSFTYHRELELYTRLGMTPAQVLARATLEMARYVGRDQQLGSIARGKLADFFLVPGDPTQDIRAVKTIRLVAKDGALYFPSEVYPTLGIRPFTTVPQHYTVPDAPMPSAR